MEKNRNQKLRCSKLIHYLTKAQFMLISIYISVCTFCFIGGKTVFTQELNNNIARPSESQTFGIICSSPENDTYDPSIIQIYGSTTHTRPIIVINNYFKDTRLRTPSKVSSNVATCSYGLNNIERKSRERNFSSNTPSHTIKLNNLWFNLNSHIFKGIVENGALCQVNLIIKNTIFYSEPSDRDLSSFLPSLLWEINSRNDALIYPLWRQQIQTTRYMRSSQKRTIIRNEEASSFNRRNLTLLIYTSNRDSSLLNSINLFNKSIIAKSRALTQKSDNNSQIQNGSTLHTSGDLIIPANFHGNCVVIRNNSQISYECPT